MRPSLSLLCHTIADNAFGRTLVIAELLKEDFEVHIVAACKPGDELWGPARTRCDFEIRRWTPGSYPGFLARAPYLARKLVTGDVVMAVKPHLASLGLGLVARRVLGRPLIADVDDWELGFSDLVHDLTRAPWALISTSARMHTRIYSARIRSADAVTVSNRFLHARYGGTWIPHARDEGLFSTFKSEAGGCFTVLFAGTPRVHKGLGTLIRAFRRVPGEARLRIVGGSLSPELSVEAASDTRISIEGPVPMSDLYAIVGSCDVVAIPQSLSRASWGQLPAKLIDAMAMGKPIVSTNVGDIPLWLDGGAGCVVAPDDVNALADALAELCLDPQRRHDLGKLARQRFLEYGSYRVVRPRLVGLVHDVLGRRPIVAQPAPFSDL